MEKLEGMQVSIDKGNYVALKLGSLPMFSMMPDEARVLASRLLLVADAAAAAAKLEDTN